MRRFELESVPPGQYRQAQAPSPRRPGSPRDRGDALTVVVICGIQAIINAAELAVWRSRPGGVEFGVSPLGGALRQRGGKRGVEVWSAVTQTYAGVGFASTVCEVNQSRYGIGIQNRHRTQIDDNGQGCCRRAHVAGRVPSWSR